MADVKGNQSFKKKFLSSITAIAVFVIAIYVAVLLSQITSNHWFLAIALVPLLWVQFHPVWRRRVTETRPNPRPNWPLAAALWVVLFIIAQSVFGSGIEGALFTLCILLLVIVAILFFIQAWSRHVADNRAKFPFDWLN
jgi:hypothetical protein